MLTLTVAIVLFLFFGVVLLYLYQGPIFVPTHAKTVDLMVSEAHIVPGMKTVDLGSGDGRVVVGMARAGAIATGFEINPLLVWYSRFKIKRLGFAGSATISTSNFWNHNLGEYDVLTVFGIDHVMDRLGKKLVLELKPSAVVISNAFHIPQLSQIKQVGSLIIYKK